MKCKCKQCGYEWETRKDEIPVACPSRKCRSRKWNKREKTINISDTYEYLTILKTRVEPLNKNKGRCCLVKCKCGTVKIVRICDVVSGRLKSCGCLIGESATERQTTHGMTGTSTWKSWISMRNRCYRKNLRAYKWYGRRGITVCDRWLHSFENFLNDMGERPIGKSLDRISSDGNYAPENCRWATPKEQANNTRRNHYIEFNGEILTRQQLCDKYNISLDAFRGRIRKGCSVETAIATPVKKRTPKKNYNLELFGLEKSIEEWAKISPVNASGFRKRLNRGWTLTQAIVFHPILSKCHKYDNYIKNKGVGK